MRKLLLGGAMSVLALSSLALGPAQAAPIDVFVAYADNLRASGFFPTPLARSAGCGQPKPWRPDSRYGRNPDR